MDIKKVKSPGINIKPVGDQITYKKSDAKNQGIGADIDEPAIAALLGNNRKTLSKYFVGAPVWTSNAEKRLEDFVCFALSKNKMFKDKPLATEETARKVTKAIKSSPQLTAKFLPFLKGQHS